MSTSKRYGRYKNKEKKKARTWPWFRAPVAVGCMACGKPRYAGKKFCYWCLKRKGLI